MFLGEAMDGTDEQPTLREKAYESFTRHLLARDVRPGQFVSQRRLVELTGLTLGAIRELIPRLEAEGLIKTVPQRGLQIAHIDLNLIREAFQLRVFLEKEAVALFTRSASEETIAGLLKQHRDIADAIRNGDGSHELEVHAQAVDWGMHVRLGGGQQTVVLTVPGRPDFAENANIDVFARVGAMHPFNSDTGKRTD